MPRFKASKRMNNRVVSFIHGTFLIEAIEQYIRTSQLVMRSTEYYNGNTKNDARYRLKEENNASSTQFVVSLQDTFISIDIVVGLLLHQYGGLL